MKNPVQAHKKNFDSLSKAFQSGNVALVECTLKSTGEKIAAVCAVNRKDGTFELVPFAIMMNGNPYELLAPPGGMEEDGKVEAPHAA